MALINKIASFGNPAGAPFQILILIVVLALFEFLCFARIIRGQALVLRMSVRAGLLIAGRLWLDLVHRALAETLGAAVRMK